MSHLKTEEAGFPLGSDATESVFRSVTEAEVSLDEMLSLACRQGKQDIVELLLESGANVNHRNKAGNTPLLEACSQGHVSIAKLLLDRHADIDAPTETTFDSALTWACTLGNIDIVTILLEHKANVEHRTKDGCTALMFAALAGHEKVARLLLDHKAKINVESDSNKDSPLTFACWKGHQKVVKLFLERKANIEHRTKEGFSPLMFAALGGHTQVAELLLKHKAEVNTPSGSNNDIPLTSACWKGHHQVVRLLLQHSSDIEHRTKDGCTPLMLAAREGHLSVAKLLLEHNAKVNVPSGSENNIPLTLACWKGHRDVVDLLLDNASNIEHQNKAGCTPLMLAAREGHLNATQLLLDSAAQIDVPSGSNDDTPLTLACWKGHDEVVQLLIERLSSVNHQTKTGCTPLMEATREGHVGVARLLLEAGADVETPDNYGQSPFFMACWKGHAVVAALLLEYDANKDCRTKTGITPLFQACRENHVDVVKLLLDYGCNSSTPFPNSRECPLTLAAEKGYTDLAELLLTRGANVETRTKKGCSPFFLACKEGFTEISIMLANNGASIEAPDQRGTTPLLAAYKNGCVEVVEWLLAHVAHLPSDQDCQKALMSPMPADTDLLPQRSKCLELIMKAKKAREQAALKNAQSLFEELDAEREKKETKKKAAAKKRDKRKQKKRNQQAEKVEALCCDDEEEGDQEQRPVEGRQDPEVVEVTDSPPTTFEPASQPPEAPASHSSTGPSTNKKTRKKSKKKSRANQTQESNHVTLAPPTPSGYLSDSADSLEFHDAQSELPDYRSVEYAPPKPASDELSSSQDSVKESPAFKHDTHPLSRQQPSPRQPLKLAPQIKLQRSLKAVEKQVSDKVKASLPSKNQKEMRSSAKAQPFKARTKPVSPSTTNVPPITIATQGAVSNSMPTSSHSKTKSHASSSADTAAPVAKNRATTPMAHREEYASSVNVPKKQGRKAAGSGEQTNKVLHVQTSRSTRDDRTASVSPAPSNQSFYDNDSHVTTSQDSADKVSLAHDENVWNTQNDWEGMDLVMLSRYSTDDDKIRSQKLQAAAAAQTYTPATRPSSTAAFPTPTTHATTHSHSTPVTSGSSTVSSTSQSWHEVTRTTRTVQLTVSNNLVGRIIGRGGSKINNIQDASGAHINVSRNIPKSTDRLITIRGTQRSITRAKELIDEALSTPEGGALISATPSPVPSLDGDIRLTPSHTSQLQRSVSPATQSLKRKYVNVVPTTVTSPSSSHASLTTTVSETSQYISTEISSSINTLSPSEAMADKSSSLADIKSAKQNAWSHDSGGGSFAAVAAIAGSTHLDDRPHLLRPSSSMSSTNRADIRESDFAEDLESNTDFPPLARSHSDPQMNTEEQTKEGDKDNAKETQSLGLQMSKFPMATKLPPNRSFSPTMASIDVVSPQKTEPPSSGVSVEKLPFSSPESEETEEVIEEGTHTTTTFRGPSKSDGQVVGLAVIEKTERHRQHRVSLPAKPLATDGDPSSDIPSDLPGRGNYGAIGPPPRRISIPSSFGGQMSPSRKLSYAGLPQFRQFPNSLENLGENDSLQQPPPGSPHPPQEGVWFPDPGGPRERSFSWAGQNFHGPPPFQHPPQGPFPHKLHHHHPKPDHSFSPRSSPGPHHRDVVHSQGVYGAIGSSVPSTHVTKSHSLPNPHTPPPYPHLFNRAEMWMHSQPVAMGQNRQPNTYGFPPPRPPPHFHPQPFPSPGHPMGFNPSHPGPKQLGNHRPVRHSFNHDENQGGGHHWGGKRWSVPGYSSFPRPAVPIWGQPPPGHGPLMSEQHGDNAFLSGNGSLSVGDPWSSSWSNLSTISTAPTQRQAPPTSSQPSMHYPASSSSKVIGSAPTESWLSSSAESDGSEPCVGGDLGQLLKSLDISDEHVRALKARRLSLQQLHSMSDEEWRSLKLPVGPRVKLMNAVSNITLSGDESKGEGKPPSEQADDRSTGPSRCTLTD